MPWEIDDVDKHKKGLKDTQKKQWVAIANKTISACLKKGKGQKECEAMAIKAANGVVGHSSGNQLLCDKIIKNSGYVIRKEILNGISYVVVPVVMMVEGVHKGSAGKVFYSAEELSKTSSAWNGRYVPVYHPKDGENENVSCNSPDMIEKYAIGQIFNTGFNVEKKSLVSELWLDEEKTKRISPEVLIRVLSGVNLEVSTGLLFDEMEIPGKWKDEEYEMAAINIIPDHLAVLPNEVGACSWSDGCGVRFNSRKKETRYSFGKEAQLTLNKHDISHEELRKKISELIFPLKQVDVMNYPAEEIYIEQVYDNYFIVNKMKEGKSHYIKQGYLMDEDGNVSLEGDAQEVEKQIIYNSVVEFLKEGGKKKMAKNKEEVDFILGVKQMEYEEKDRETLEKMEDPVFINLKSYAQKFANCKACNGTQVQEPIKKAATLEELIFNATAEIQEMVNDGVRMVKDKKAGLIAAIKANKRNKFTDVQLGVKQIDELEMIVNLAAIDVDYSLQGGGTSQVIKANERTPEGMGVPVAPIIDWNKAKK